MPATCQTKIAKAIIDEDADYLLALKKNQGCLYEDVQLLFDNLDILEPDRAE